MPGMGLSLILSFFMISFYSCGNASSTKAENDEAKVDESTFYQTQPVHSGLYDADYYDITGNNPRKGKFDGRIYIALSPETSAFRVFENGNRTKIDQTVVLEKPFEKGDSNIYYSLDMKGNQVTINTDSTTYFLNFKRGNDDYKIGFSPKPRHESSALEILEKMRDQNKK